MGGAEKRTVAVAAATAVVVASLVVVAGAGSVPVRSQGRRARKNATASSALVPVPPATAQATPLGSLGNLGNLGNEEANPSGVGPASAASTSTSAVGAAAPARLVIGAGTRVLCFGDSFTDAGFSQRLQQLVEQRGGRFFRDGWTSATTKSWGTTERLPQLLAATKPDVVIVVLGANEVLVSSPEKMAPFARSITARLAPRACAWVSPPLWKGETGIVGVMRAESAPCGFFDSGALALEKRADGIHTTAKGGGQWADAFWATMVSRVSRVSRVAPVAP